MKKRIIVSVVVLLTAAMISWYFLSSKDSPKETKPQASESTKKKVTKEKKEEKVVNWNDEDVYVYREDGDYSFMQFDIDGNTIKGTLETVAIEGYHTQYPSLARDTMTFSGTKKGNSYPIVFDEKVDEYSYELRMKGEYLFLVEIDEEYEEPTVFVAINEEEKENYLKKAQQAFDELVEEKEQEWLSFLSSLKHDSFYDYSHHDPQLHVYLYVTDQVDNVLQGNIHSLHRTEAGAVVPGSETSASFKATLSKEFEDLYEVPASFVITEKTKTGVVTHSLKGSFNLHGTEIALPFYKTNEEIELDDIQGDTFTEIKELFADERIDGYVGMN